MSIYTDTLTQSRLKEVLHYNPDTGDWTWIVSNSNRKPVGSKAGTIGDSGYSIIRIDGKKYRSHRLAFLYMNGSWPKEYVDHANRNRNDNRWCNLREATVNDNNRNRGLSPLNKSGYKGVYWREDRSKWVSRIKVNNKIITLGHYHTKEEAIKVRQKAEKTYHGEFVI